MTCCRIKDMIVCSDKNNKFDAINLVCKHNEVSFFLAYK